MQNTEYRIQNTEYRIQNVGPSLTCRSTLELTTARDKGGTADAVGLQAAQTYDHESGEPQEWFRFEPSIHPWNSLCLGAQVVQVNTESDRTSARRRHRDEREYIDEHTECARTALHERPFSAHPSVHNTQNNMTTAPPLVWFHLPAYVCTCLLALVSDRDCLLNM